MGKKISIALLSLALLLSLIGCQNPSGDANIPTENSMGQTEATRETVDSLTEESAGVSSADISTTPEDSDNEGVTSDTYAEENMSEDDPDKSESGEPSMDASVEDSSNESNKESTDEDESGLVDYDSATEGGMLESPNHVTEESQPSCGGDNLDTSVEEEPEEDETSAPDYEDSDAGDDMEEDEPSDEGTSQVPEPGNGIVLPDDEW